MEVIIISEALFKENSPVGTNVNLEDWTPYILAVQKLYMRKILGPVLLTELQDQIKLAQVIPAPVTNPISPDNRALLIEIAPALAFYSVYQGLPFQWAKIQNKGVTTLKSENSEGISYTDVAKLQTKTKIDAEAFVTDLIKYLCQCADKYPSWSPAPGYGCADKGFECCKGGVQRNDTGIFIPKRRGSCGY
jgi:hypothetical protein